MSGVTRFLSKREKPHRHHFTHHHEKSISTDNISSTAKPQLAVDPESAADFYGLFVASKPASITEEPKVKSIRQKVVQAKGVLIKDCHILWALRSRFGPGDPDTAFDLLVAMSDASEGIITPYDPNMRLRGSNNRELVTCFLDSTLFAMFSRLDSFEAMLYNSFNDLPREKLAFLLRLWVNLLRRGKLITTDITEEIQNSLAECGWDDARELRQQDASEAFAFITEKLNLPLLTLKMDIYHTGKQDNDDHKLIKERLLEVGIPRMPDGNVPAEIKLEDCLEEFFNNKIEVKRYLERRNTLTSLKSFEAGVKDEKSIHVETVEIDADLPTPLTPLSTLSTYPSHSSYDRPQNRHRAASIIQERFIPDKEDRPVDPKADPRSALGRVRGGSLRKEVVMPAWQFFSLIPWYTDHAPSTDARMADHFSVKRPVLGLCLKRYDFTRSGEAIRLNTDVDVPVDIALPHFIQDDRTDAEESSFGNFKLSLQSAVCHRGDSVHSGHYISLVKSDTEDVKSGRVSHWLRFDDLATPKVTLIDIHRALKEEKPYLLFYQILPVDGDPGNLTVGEQPPSYPATPALATPALATPALEHGPVTPALDSGPGSVQGDPLIAVQSISSSSMSGRASSQRSSSDETRGRSPEHQVRRQSAVSFSEHLPVPRKSIEGYREQAFADYRAPEHKKSGSTSSNGGLGRKLSKLTRRGRSGGSKEELPLPKPEPAPVPAPTPEVRVSEAPTLANSSPKQNNYLAEPPTDPNRSKSVPTQTPLQPSAGLGRSHSKREKSRNRLMKAAGKGRGDDPDRECIVM